MRYAPTLVVNEAAHKEKGKKDNGLMFDHCVAARSAYNLY
jgi:hypothetical protein